jgi:osmotically-inducible protein OsmY
MNVNNVNVVVERGDVTLSGTVPSWTAKRSAYNAASYTLGVKNVVNNIVISPL